MKLLTLEDYQKAGETFWPKYWYVAKELGEDAKPEQVLKVMEAVGGLALKLAVEKKEGPVTENVEVMGSHIGMGHNPAILACIAERLSQPEGKWRPFKHTTMGKLFYSHYF